MALDPVGTENTYRTVAPLASAGSIVRFGNSLLPRKLLPGMCSGTAAPKVAPESAEERNQRPPLVLAT